MEDPWADSAGSGTGAGAQPDDNTSTPTSPAQPAAAPSLSAPSTTTSSARPSRLTPRRLVAQPTRLQAVEDDPLGPLGAAPAAAGGNGDNDVLAAGATQPPVPPMKEQLPLRTTMPGPGSGSAGSGVGGKGRRAPDPHRIEDDDDNEYGGEGDGQRAAGGRQPPPVQAALPSPVRSATQPSVSVEQAARPSFYIAVGDPHKVGDLATSHIVYSVRTKVCFFFLVDGGRE